MNAVEKENPSIRDKTESWFSELIHSIEVKKLTYEQDTISHEEKSLYEAMATKNQDQILSDMVMVTQRYYFTKLINEFFKELFGVRKSKEPLKIAFDHKGKQIMTWLEIPNGDEQMEDNIFLAEAVVNSNFAKTGFSISATVVEEQDGLAIPGHYEFLKS